MRLVAIALLALVNRANGPATGGINIGTPQGQSAMHVTMVLSVRSDGAATHLHRRGAQVGGSSKASDVVVPGRRSATVSPRIMDVCQSLTGAAHANGLPLDFLTRLIWQESRFRSDAVSPAGAEGVAQFMPATANNWGLADPFDAPNAITKSAELLRNLKEEFGNLGLAAAAYNAGSERVHQWLATRRRLPAETRAYVRIVTGRTIESWTSSQQASQATGNPLKLSCPQTISLLLRKSHIALPAEKHRAMPSLLTAWGVQLLGDSSQPAVIAAYHRLQKQYRIVLGNRQPVVIRSPTGRRGYWYRVRIAADSLSEAQKLCGSLRALGGNCLVQRN